MTYFSYFFYHYPITLFVCYLILKRSVPKKINFVI